MGQNMEIKTDSNTPQYKLKHLQQAQANDIQTPHKDDLSQDVHNASPLQINDQLTKLKGISKKKRRTMAGSGSYIKNIVNGPNSKTDQDSFKIPSSDKYIEMPNSAKKESGIGQILGLDAEAGRKL